MALWLEALYTSMRRCSKQPEPRRLARTGRRLVVEEALREHLGLDVIDVVRRRSDLTDEEAMRLAVEEVHAVREERAARHRP